MTYLYSAPLFECIALMLGASFLVFRSETKKAEISVSTVTQSRFVIAAAGCCLFAVIPLGYFFPIVGGICALPFMFWPLMGLWLVAAPVNNRSRSAYLLSVASLLSIVYWYIFWNHIRI